MIQIYSDRAVFSQVYKNHKSFLAVETDDILLEKQNIIFFEVLMQYFDTIFDYTYQEIPKLNLLNINIIQSKYLISIDQIYHIMENIIQEYWVTKTKRELKFQQ